MKALPLLEQQTYSTMAPTHNKTKTKFGIEGMTCSACTGTVERAIKSVIGVIECHVSAMDHSATVTYNPNFCSSQVIIDTIESLGFEVTSTNDEIEFNHNDVYHAKFSLEGLTCSACIGTVSGLFRAENDSFKGIVHLKSIQVTLLPTPTLELDYNKANPNDTTTTDFIIDSIEAIGFGAKLILEIKNNTDDTEGVRVRRVYVHIERNLSNALKYLSNHFAVEHCEQINPKRLKDSPNASTTANIVNVQYRDDLCGIRTLLQELLDNSDEFGSIQIKSASNYQADLEAAEERRIAEIKQWRNELIFSAIFSVPIFVISMILVKIPGPIKETLHSTSIANITWEELSTWIMATPVQFISGWRFYHDSYYQVKTMHLGMSFLIALGTTTAYLYSVFVVLYNSKTNPVPRLMVAFETSALLICFVILGKFMLAKAKARTSSALEKLASLTPDEVTLIQGDTNLNKKSVAGERKIPISLIQRNDILLIRPGEKVPVDGIIVSGTSTVDESMITGESIPKTKQVDDLCIGGTINIDGAIKVQVINVGDDTALAKIINLVQSAQNSKAPIQNYADWIAERFTPFVLIVSILTFIIWVVLLKSNVFSEEEKQSWHLYQNGFNDYTLPLLFSVSVLVIACPCALGLATPTAVMVGTLVSSKNGVLMKGGEALEAAHNISAVVFDKTGTLTQGTPKVRDILLLSPFAGYLKIVEDGDESSIHFNNSSLSKNDEDWDNIRKNMLNKELTESSCCGTFVSDSSYEDEDIYQLRKSALLNILQLTASAEYGSEHPIAKGIIEKAEEVGIGNDKEIPLLPVENFTVLMGMGIQCTIKNHSILIGNDKLLDSNQIKTRPSLKDAMEYLQKKGQTSVIVCIDGWVEAIIGLNDKPKDEAKVAVKYLQSLDIKVFMLTGDNALTAKVVAKEIGINPENIFAEKLPEGKVDCVKELQNAKEVVAMVGDGINDSPAMAQALGIAIGAGTDVALETASIVLVNSKVTDVCVAIDIAKTIYKRIKLNFFWALGYNTVAIPFAAGIFFPLMKRALPPYIAALAMTLSSVSVLISSLLLNQYQPPDFVLTHTMKGAEPSIESTPSFEIHTTRTDTNTSKSSKIIDNIEGLSLFDHFPGCQSSWGKTCKCVKCKCPNCSTCTTIASFEE